MTPPVVWPLPVDPETFARLAAGQQSALLSPLVAFAVGDSVSLQPSAQAPSQLARGAPAVPAAPQPTQPPVHATITHLEAPHPALTPGWCVVHLHVETASRTSTPSTAT